MIKYCNGGKHAIFNNLKFTRDDKTGYYLNSNNKLRLHRAVWIYYNGEIPTGYHIHHKDGNKNNNNIENLKLIYKTEHLSHHGKERFNDSTNYKKQLEHLSKIQVKASEWHKSDAGRKWHSEHAKQIIDDMKPKKFICLHCGKEYEQLPIGNHKFCSNACKSAWRRKQGIDNVTKQCEYCGKSFVSNRYKKTRFCSRSCVNRATKGIKNKVN